MAKITNLFAGDEFTNNSGTRVYVECLLPDIGKVKLKSNDWKNHYLYDTRDAIDRINSGFYTNYKTHIPDHYYLELNTQSEKSIGIKLLNYYRRRPLDDKSLRNYKGSGLGLYIVNHSSFVPRSFISTIGGKVTEIQLGEHCPQLVDYHKALSILNTLNLNKNGNSNKQEEHNEEIESVDKEIIPSGHRGSGRERIRVQAQRREVQITSIEEQDSREDRAQEERIKQALKRRRNFGL